MASDLENIADAIRRVGDGSGPHLRAAREAIREAARITADFPSGAKGAAQTAMSALQIAQKHANTATAELAAFGSGANAFAARLVGGDADGAAVAGESSPSTGATSGSGSSGGSVAKSLRSIDEIDQVLASRTINPEFGQTPSAGENCGRCSANLFDYLNGSTPVAAGDGTLDDREMEQRTGLPERQTSPEEIEARLRANGAGSHCVVGIWRNHGDGHWFNAWFDGSQVWTLDAQSGSRYPWPRDYGDVKSWDSSLPG